MMRPVEMSAIGALLRRARRRIRVQAALEAATTVSVLASAVALVAVYCVRIELIAPVAGIAILVGSGVLIVAAAIRGAMRPLDDERIARRIDRASNLSDRLSTAIAFKTALLERRSLDELTRAMMLAAVRDAMLASPRADVRAATPFSRPRHGRVAVGFFLVSALTAGLALPNATPHGGGPESTPGQPTTAEQTRPNTVALDPDEIAYVRSIAAELNAVAERDRVPELAAFAAEVEQLVANAQAGAISKETLLEALAKAEATLAADSEPTPDEITKQFKDIGKNLARDPVTAELGTALANRDLEKAQRQLENLADKLTGKQLTARDKQHLSEQLAQAAKHIADQDRDQAAQRDQRQQKLSDDIRRLEAQKRDAKTDRERHDIERRLENQQRELRKLQKDEQDKQQSAQRRALKRLQKDLEQAAENLHKPSSDSSGQDERDHQASENLRDAARETGRVDRDQRKQAAQTKVASQMDDLREAMRRAKQKTNKGPIDPFNKNGKNRDFMSRARGHKGSGQAWKPGQGQSQVNGGQGNGSGQGSDSPQWGEGHDDNLTGDPTAMTGNTKDDDLQGKASDRGGSTRETILAAAQKGFASVGYKNVYANYQRIVEEVMRNEKVPSSYKYYVKRYFAKIHPNIAAPGSDTESASP